jgi:hypothetical protein
MEEKECITDPKLIHTHEKLVQIAYRWVMKRAACGVAFKELNTCSGEYPDVIGFGSWGHSVLIEVKVSRSDFLKDKTKKFRKQPELGMGKYRYFCCPTGLIKVTDLPENWGLIYVNDKGRATCVHNPYGKTTESNVFSNGFEQNMRAEHTLMYSALRRLHIKGHIDTIYDKDYQYGGGFVR